VPDASINLSAGWNLVGVHDEAVAASAVTTTPSGLLETGFFAFVPGSGYEPPDSLRPGNGYWIKASAAGTLHLPADMPSTYTITFNIDEVELSSWEAPGDLEELIVEAGPNTYTLDTSDETATATITVPSSVTEITVMQDDADYISTFVANNSWNEPLPDWSEEPDYQGNTSLTIPVSALNQNGDSEYQVTVIPVESPDGYSTIGDISSLFNSNRVRRWKAENPNLELAIVAEGENGTIYDGEMYDDMVEGTNVAVNAATFPINIVEYTTVQEFLDNTASPRNNTDVSIVQIGNSSNGAQYIGDFIKNSSSSGASSNTFKSEVYESLLGHDDPGLVFVNPNATYNDTASWFSKVVYTLESNSDLD